MNIAITTIVSWGTYSICLLALFESKIDELT